MLSTAALRPRDELENVLGSTDAGFTCIMPRAGGLAMTDIATRVYNHTWKIDPIVRSVIDTDFYKLLMAQSILRHNPDTRVTFSLINRSARVPLARLIDEDELREQLDHIRTLSLSRGESTWLRGNTFYGKRWMFDPEFIEWLEGFRFPEYRLERKGEQYELTFAGRWVESMMWEIPALAVIMELRSRAVLRHMGRFELEVLYARAMARVWEKVTELRALDTLRIADFGTRRRHGFLWQDWCVQAMHEGLGPEVRRHIELPDRHAPRGRGGRHQRARAADGLCGARRDGRGAGAARPTACWRTGRPTMAATCWSSCPIPSRPRGSYGGRPTGWRAGRACASTRAIPWRAARR